MRLILKFAFSCCINSNFSDRVAVRRRRLSLLTKTRYPSWLLPAHDADEHSQHEDPPRLTHQRTLGVDAHFLPIGLKGQVRHQFLWLHEQLGVLTRLLGLRLHAGTPACISGT